MKAVVTCEFMLAAGICDESNIQAAVMDLVGVARCLREYRCDVVVEDDAIGKMQGLGYYPSDKFFDTNIGACTSVTYSGKDIAKTVSSILSRAEVISGAFSQILAQWAGLALNPAFGSTSKDRVLELNDIVEVLALNKSFDNVASCILHFFEKVVPSSIIVTGEVVATEPMKDVRFPYVMGECIQVYARYLNCLMNFDGLSFYKNAETDSDFKFSFFVGMLNEIRDRGGDLGLVNFDCFSLGFEFVASLRQYGGSAEQPYAGVVFSTIVNVLLGTPKYPKNPFLNVAGGTQRMRGLDMAWRTHITKGGAALRLMFWTRPNEHIALANIGNKNDLYIAE